MNDYWYLFCIFYFYFFDFFEMTEEQEKEQEKQREKEICKEIVETIYDKYAENDYMRKRILHFFQTQIGPMFENIQKNHVQRQTHAIEMSIEQENFIQNFIQKYKYYYVPATDRFIRYDELRYTSVSEDDILYHILSDISKDRTLMTWKQRTKITIMKRIRETSIYRTIPNSETIQTILDSFCPLLFTSKTEVKYFLAVIGDNLLKKQQQLIHLISPKAKPFLRELNNYAQICLGSNIYNTFKYKYHEHDYANCRVLNILDTVKSTGQWTEFLKLFALDILCVAVHYSTRYDSADSFLMESNMDKEIENNILFLKNHSQCEIVDHFLYEYIRPSSESDSMIPWKTMQYLWKHYLDIHRLPAIIFQSNLKQLLIERWQCSMRMYDVNGDVFVGAFSKYMPSIQSFLSFWSENMVYDITEYDLEIDEIAMLFRMDCKNRGETVHSLSDKQILDFISYFFTEVEIENDKYVQKWKCRLWDKSLDIAMAIDAYSSEFMNSSVDGCSSPMHSVSIYELYENYSQKKHAEHLPVVNKQYFEKYVFDNMGENVVDGKFIELSAFF